MNRLRSERGQAAVLSVVFIAALLGAMAMVLDVGSWFREQRATQSAADAAALAAAQALPENTGTRERTRRRSTSRTNGGGRRRVQLLDAERRQRHDLRQGDPRGRRRLREALRDRLGRRAREGECARRRPDSASCVAPIAVERQASDAELQLLNGKPVPCFGPADPIDSDLKDERQGRSRRLPADQPRPSGRRQCRRDRPRRWIVQRLRPIHAARLVRLSPVGEVQRHAVQREALASTAMPSCSSSRSTTRFTARARTATTTSSAGSASSSRASTPTATRQARGRLLRPQVIWEGIRPRTGANLNYGVRADRARRITTKKEEEKRRS